MTDGARSNYFQNLDGFRFLAFLFVFLNHAFTIEGSSDGLSGLFKQALLRNGASGVSFFFVLSGFLLTHQILQRQAKSNFSLKNFYIRRILRIWPLYFLCLFLTFIFAQVSKGITPLTPGIFHWSYWCFMSNFHLIDKLHHSIAIVLPLDITWSIAIEEQFYLLLPLFLISCKSPRHKITSLCAIIIFALVYRVYFNTDHATHYFHTLPAFYEFALGGLLAALAINGLPTSITYMPSWFIQLVYLFGTAWVLLNGEQFLVRDARLVTPLFFAFVILDQSFLRNSYFKMANNKVATRLGKYTYAMYLLHPMALWGTQFLFSRIKLGNEMYIAMIGLVITVAASMAAYHLIEKRFLNLKKRFK